MKTQLLSLVAICLASAAAPEREIPPANNPAPTQILSPGEAKNADAAKATTDAPAPDLAKRIQSVTNPKSPLVTEIVKMAEAGIDSSVIEAFVQTAIVPLLRPDEILFLHEKGVSSQVITTLIKRSGEVKTQQAQAQKESQERLAQQQANQSAAAAQQTTPQNAQAPATFNYYVAPPAYPAHAYTYPVYSYAYPVYTYGYAPYRSSYRSSVCPPSYAARYNRFHYSHQPHSSMSVGVHTPGSGSFFASRWTWNGGTGKPVDFHR